jgi:hypothetical protein
MIGVGEAVAQKDVLARRAEGIEVTSIEKPGVERIHGFSKLAIDASQFRREVPLRGKDEVFGRGACANALDHRVRMIVGIEITQSERKPFGGVPVPGDSRICTRLDAELSSVVAQQKVAGPGAVERDGHEDT